MVNKITFLLLAAALTGLASCSSESVDPAETEYVTNDVDLKAYVAKAANPGSYTLTNSGMYYVITQANPLGQRPAIGDEITFNYQLFSGKDVVIDTVYRTKPTYYVFGIGQVISGFEEGVSYLREGERATLLLPSYLAYGPQSQTGIPAYSNLRFEVSLLRTRTEDQQIDEYVTANKLAVTEKTSTGLRFIKTLSNTTGNALVSGQTVSVKYSRSNLRSTTSLETGTFDVVLGANGVVAGFEEGIRKLRVGEKATLVFPSIIGYGKTGRVNASNQYVVLPYAPMVFEIEVTAVK
jgi:FKBP-type peptidyl-prolyl cis-trans isomerase